MSATSDPTLRVAAVLPVRGHPSLLDGCLAGLRAQTRRIDDVVVVDDSPAGDLGEVSGARVLRSGGRGPYAARNVGWRATDAHVVLFLDARSRPRAEWAQRMAAPFAQPDVALAGSDVQVLSGPRLAARAAARRQNFRLGNYLSRTFFRPYLPTCNLGARREDLEAVGGFDEGRSGGDADLCWRILARPGRRLEPVHEVLMDWVPRDRLRDLLEQYYRYGRSNHALRRRWAAAGAPPREPVGHLALAKRVAFTAAGTALAALRRRPEAVLDGLDRGLWLANEMGYRVARDRERLGMMQR